MTTIFEVRSKAMLMLALATIAGHTLLLHLSTPATLAAPASDLSLNGIAVLHALVLCMMGVSFALLAQRLSQKRCGRVRRFIQILCVFNALLLASLGYCFTVDNLTLHTVLLAVIASNTGVVVGFIAVISFTKSKASPRTLLQISLLAVLFMLIPVYPWVEPEAIGLYSRGVGLVLVMWLAALSFYQI